MKRRIIKNILPLILISTLMLSACANNNNDEIINENSSSESIEISIDESTQSSEEIINETDNENADVTTDTNADIASDKSLDNVSDLSDEADDKVDENEDLSLNVSSENNDSINVLNDENSSAANSNNSEIKKITATPVAQHGELSVKGTKIVDKNGDPFLIQGVSTHGIAWFPDYINKDSFKTMRDEWGINTVRLAMYTAENNGYCEGGDKNQIKNLVDNGVSYATELGLYVIIDWHVLHDLDPNKYKSDAISFFDEMSKKYADYDNVIYEICNEPNGGTSWSSIKSYALEVIPVIKKNNPNAIIVVGTPNWSQDVDQAANDPITGYSNILYTVHFYAATHKADLRNKMTNAISKGLPILCTEFGITDASGNGALDENEADKWIAEMQKNGVGYCIWNLSNKAESSSLINSGCNKTSGWTENDLSQEAKWYLKILGGKALGNISSSAVDNSNNNNSSNNNNNNNNNSNNNSNNNNSNNNNSNNNNSNNNNSNNNSNAVTASSENIQVSISNTGNWTSGSNNCYQYTVNIKNTASTSVKNWKLTVNMGSNVSLDQSWSGSFSINGANIIITPCEYNNEIASGQSCEIGFIVSTTGSLGNPSISIN